MRPLRSLFALCIWLLSRSALAATDAEPDPCPGTRIAARLDNDLLGAQQQDQGYTGGTFITLTSPSDVSCSDSRREGLTRWLRRQTAWLIPAGYADQNTVLSVRQALYTPSDSRRRDLILDDRPYAAVLLASFDRNARRDDTLWTTQIQIGLVGPAALGEQTQRLAHQIFGNQQFEGWSHQLRSEPLLGVTVERGQRWRPGNGWDTIGHLGGALGNRATHLNAGIELRAGARIPDDFGSSPDRPGSEGGRLNRYESHWSGHFFLAIDIRWVARDITLDGNTFGESHRVDKRSFVADMGYGVAIARGPWRIAIAQYHRTREFEGQRDPPTYGSIVVSHALH